MTKMTEETHAFLTSLLEFYKESSSGKEPENRDAMFEAWSEIDVLAGMTKSNEDTPYQITSVARADLISEGYDASKITDDEMEAIARAMANRYVAYGDFFGSLRDIADDLSIAKIKK